MTHNRHNKTCERLGGMSLSQLLCLLCLVGVALRYLRPLNRHVVQAGETLGSSLCSSWPSRLQEMPNKPIYCPQIHQGVEKWGEDAGPAVVTSGMEGGWESCCEILVYMFGLHQKMFPNCFLLPNSQCLMGIRSPRDPSCCITGIHSAASTVGPVSRKK